MLSNTCYNLEIICDIIRTTIFGVLCSVNIPIIIRLYVLIFCHCIVCHKAIYRFWYIQYFLMVNHKRLMSSMHQHKFFIRRKLYYRENWNNQIKTNYFTDKINRHCCMYYDILYIQFSIIKLPINQTCIKSISVMSGQLKICMFIERLNMQNSQFQSYHCSFSRHWKN